MSLPGVNSYVNIETVISDVIKQHNLRNYKALQISTEVLLIPHLSSICSKINLLYKVYSINTTTYKTTAGFKTTEQLLSMDTEYKYMSLGCDS